MNREIELGRSESDCSIRGAQRRQTHEVRPKGELGDANESISPGAQKKRAPLRGP